MWPDCVDEGVSVLRLVIVSRVSLCVEPQDQLNEGALLSVHLMVLKGFKMIRVGVTHF